MFDIVHYFNTEDSRPEDVDENVAAHSDPGVFSLSLKSTAPGLQLFDPETNAWIDCPLDVAVLWCGSAVKTLNPDMPLGLHRVVRAETPRYLSTNLLSII